MNNRNNTSFCVGHNYHITLKKIIFIRFFSLHLFHNLYRSNKVRLVSFKEKYKCVGPKLGGG